MNIKVAIHKKKWTPHCSELPNRLLFPCGGPACLLPLLMGLRLHGAYSGFSYKASPLFLRGPAELPSCSQWPLFLHIHNGSSHWDLTELSLCTWEKIKGRLN